MVYLTQFFRCHHGTHSGRRTDDGNRRISGPVNTSLILTLKLTIYCLHWVLPPDEYIRDVQILPNLFDLIVIIIIYHSLVCLKL